MNFNLLSLIKHSLYIERMPSYEAVVKNPTNPQGAVGKCAPRDLIREDPIDKGLQAKTKVDLGRCPVAGTANFV